MFSRKFKEILESVEVFQRVLECYIKFKNIIKELGEMFYYTIPGNFKEFHSVF